MKAIIATTITADHPTANGSIYTTEAIERAIREFNINAKNTPSKGSILNRQHIQQVGEITHITKSLFLNESGVLCAEIEVIDPKLVDVIKDQSSAWVARPIVCLDSYVLDKKPLMVTSIKKISRVQLEYKNESKS